MLLPAAKVVGGPISTTLTGIANSFSRVNRTFSRSVCDAAYEHRSSGLLDFAPNCVVVARSGDDTVLQRFRRRTTAARRPLTPGSWRRSAPRPSTSSGDKNSKFDFSAGLA